MSLLTSLANTTIGSAAVSRNGTILSANMPVVEEGDEVHFTLYVPGGVEGTTYPYTITGISQSDLFYGTLTGNFTLNSVESANVTIILARDDVVEVETITMTVDSLNVSVQVTIDDTTSAVGEAVYEIPGAYSWTCPAGVTSVSAVAIGGGGGGRTWYGATQGGTGGGGGGLGYKNNIAVTPGETYTVVVGSGGISAGSGGDSYFISSATVFGGRGIRGNNQSGSADVTGGAGGTYTGDGGGNGGTGIVMDRTYNNGKAGGGSGAGGYGLEGGFGGGSTSTVSDFSRRNGGGGTYSGAGGGMLLGTASIIGRAGAGGGTGVFGRPPGYISTSGGTYRASSGSAGDGQQYGPQLWVSERDGNNQVIVSNKQKYGGGGPARNDYGISAGSSGAVRIMWGSGRSFPSNAEYREWDGNPTATLAQTIGSPIPATDGRFGDSISISGKYALIGARYEGSSSKGRAHIFDMTNWQLVHTLGDSSMGGSFPNFGYRSDIEGNYAAVGSHSEPDPVTAELYAGVVRVYDVTSGNLLYTIQNPAQTKEYDYFGHSLRISGIYLIVGAWGDGDVGGSESGRVHVFDMSTGNLVSTIDNPSATPTGDRFGWSVAISGNYAIIGAPKEADGKAYIFDIINGTLIKTLDNQTAFGVFGGAVAISGNYLIVGAHGDGSAGGYYGKVYIYRTTSGDWSDAILLHSISNPNSDGSGLSDYFGLNVDISGTYAVASAGSVSSPSYRSGKAYIFDVTNGTLIETLDNPSAGDDQFGSDVAISGNYIGVTAVFEDYYATNSGIAYIYKLT